MLPMGEVLSIPHICHGCTDNVLVNFFGWTPLRHSVQRAQLLYALFDRQIEEGLVILQLTAHSAHADLALLHNKMLLDITALESRFKLSPFIIWIL